MRSLVSEVRKKVEKDQMNGLTKKKGMTKSFSM